MRELIGVNTPDNSKIFLNINDKKKITGDSLVYLYYQPTFNVIQ